MATKSLCFYFLKITWLIIIYVILKGAEKKNDYLFRYFLCKINRWDAATNLLLVEKQRGVLRERERERAKYPTQRKGSPIGWRVAKRHLQEKYKEFQHLHNYTLNLHNCPLSQHNSLLNLQIYLMNLLTKN